MKTWHDKLSQWFFQQTHAETDWYFGLFIDALLFAVVLIVAAATYCLGRRLLVSVLGRTFKKTSNTWDDEILNSKLFTWFALLIPAVIILHTAPQAIITTYHGDAVFAHFIQVCARVFIVVLSFLSANSLLNIVERIYSRYEVSRELPIKSLVQVVKIILALTAIIFIIATLIGKSPVLIFSGLGAMTAIMMLVFKDSILGLVAGIQLSANRMVARGDWIEMPKFGADGEVLEVALTTVKVRNWDKTITTIPTYALISDSFKNWRGMSNSSVRRIKRSINIDISTIEFINTDHLIQLKQVSLLQNYIAEKEKDIASWNQSLPDTSASNPINARTLTNLGTFRAYVREYLKNHPSIDEKQTLLVRQLQPTEHGIPIEIYVFSNDNRWVNYEDIQSDIFDHLLSILPEFGLRVFQAPNDHSFLTPGPAPKNSTPQ